MSEFEWNYSAIYGNCYKFNSGNKVPIKTSFNLGELNGLNLRINIGNQKENLFPIQFSTGARIFVHKQFILPLNFEGINVQVGTTTNIQLTKVVTENVPTPYSDCQDLTNYNSILFNFIKNSSFIYRQKDCWDLCYQMNIIHKCGCYDLERIGYYKNKPCYLSNQDFKCMKEAYKDFAKLVYNENCTNECPMECKSESYDLKMQYSNFPSRAYSKFIISQNNSIEFSDMDKQNLFQVYREQYLQVKIYFDDFKYMSISEQKKTTEIELGANIGGTLGLFIGVSILSFVELIELMIELVIILMDAFRKKKKKGEVRRL